MSKLDIEHKTEISDPNDTTPTPKPPFSQRCKTHMKKWWWLYLIILGCIVLVTVLPIVYVGIPNFANKYINDSNYDSAGLILSNPTPHSFHVRQQQTLQISKGGGFTGSGYLTAFNASMHAPDSTTQIAAFQIPRIDFGNGASIDIDQELELDCVECFSELARSAASSKDFAVIITGKPDLKIGALPTAHLNIHKTLKMQGYNAQEFINKEGAFNVTKLDILNPRSPEGYNVNATIAFQNPSTFSVEMGAVSLNLTIGDTTLGYVDLPDLTLQRNVTNTVMLGNINTTLLIQQGLWASGNDEYGVVDIDIHGNRCVYGGQEIPYLTAAIRAMSASRKINFMDYVHLFL